MPDFNILTSVFSSNLHTRNPQARNTSAPPPSFVDGVTDINQSCPMVLLTFKKSHLVNLVKLEMLFFRQNYIPSSHPASGNNLMCMPEQQADGMKVSFTLKSSQDNSNWITLANYEELDCMGEITLSFPSQSLRYTILCSTCRKFCLQARSALSLADVPHFT